MQKCESAKANMYKMQKFDAKDFTFYTSPFWVNLSHFRIIRKSASSSTPIHKILRQAEMEW